MEDATIKPTPDHIDKPLVCVECRTLLEAGESCLCGVESSGPTGVDPEHGFRQRRAEKRGRKHMEERQRTKRRFGWY